METKKVWFVTGASKGLGLALVRKLVATGYRVAATTRNLADLANEPGLTSANFLPLQVDLVEEQSVANAVGKTLEVFGGIDVVVNNAGYGQLGTLEETTDKEARQNFDTNVFGMLNVIRHILPHFRSQGSGHFFNISSIAGFVGAFPGWGLYNATKFAVAGLSEALQAETKSFGIRTTIVFPGYFKTNFLHQGSLRLAEAPIAAYKEARELEHIHASQIIGNQPGDPERAADALIRTAESIHAPHHLFLGSDALNMAKGKLEGLSTELVDNEALSISTDFQQ